MTAKRLTIILASSLAALLIGLVAGTYLLSKAIDAESRRLATNRASVEQLTSQENNIAKSKRDIAKYAPLEDITKAIVPQDKDQAATVREITRIASANRITLTTITFPSSTLGGTGVPGVKPSTGAAAAAATNAKPNLSQLTPVKGLAGVYNLQITLANNTANPVSYGQLVNFLRGLENNRRTAAVSSINIQPQQSRPTDLVFNLIINTYIKP